MFYINFSLILVMMSVILFCKFYKHLLMVLMCIEFLMLTVLYVIYMVLSIEGMSFYFLIFIVYFVIESVLGLSMLVNLIYFSGSDYVKNLNLIMW